MMAGAFKLERNNFGRLVLVLDGGVRHEGVVPVRAFPIAAPEEGLSLVSTDGHEVLWIEQLDALPAAMRALIDEELSSREFTPRVLKLLSVSSFSTPSTWEVETDRGVTRFMLKGEEDIRRLGRSALLISSGQGIHFSVPDMLALDRHSRRLLERFL
jgi:hypothetical protein